MKTAFLFPGQGAQKVGMGKDVYDNYEEARQIFDMAEKVTGVPVKKLCFEGPEEDLMKTENTQIAILTTSLAMLEVLKKYGIKAEMSVGLSLGEYTALIYGGYLGLEDGFKIIQKRGYYMGNFLPKESFSMVAVVGLDSSIIEEECAKVNSQGKFVVPANYNSKAQTVISGSLDAIEEVSEKLKQLGAKKVVTLKTSGPFHTEKLNKAKELFSKDLEKVTFKKGNGVKVIKKIDGKIYENSDNMKEILANHIINPVRFDRAIEIMKNEKVTDFIEIGPGKALAGFVKKDYPEAQVYNVNDLKSLQELIEKNN